MMSSSPNPYEPPSGLVEPGAGSTIEFIKPIQFSGVLTVDDAYKAESLAQPTSNKIAIGIVYLFVVLGLVYMLGVAAYAYFQGEYNMTRLAALGSSLPLLLIVLFIGRRLLNRRRANQLWRERKWIYFHSVGQVSNESIESKTESASSAIEWTAFCGYRKSDRVAVLFYEKPGPFMIFARTKFATDDEWQRFLDLVSSKLPLT